MPCQLAFPACADMSRVASLREDLMFLGLTHYIEEAPRHV